MLHLPRVHPLPGFFSRTLWAKRLILSLILMAGAAIAADLDEPHHVTAVRFWSLGEVTRIAVETDGDFTVHSDRLEDPDRIFYDLSGTKPSLGPQMLTVIPVLDRFVRQIRV